MSKPRFNPLLFMGLIGIFTIGSHFGVQLYRAFGQDRDIWWTPRSRALAFEEATHHFRLFISGKLIQDHIAEKGLFALDDRGQQYPVVTRDLTVRLNNWKTVQASILANMLITSFSFGIVITVLVIGLIQVFSRRRAAKPPTSGV